MILSSGRNKAVFAVGALAFAILLVTLLLVLVLPSSSELDPPNPDSPPPPSDAPMGVFRQAAVAANGYLCAPIGKEVMMEGGNAVDAAIATLLCEGVMNIQSMGLGGGFLMTIYMKATNTAVVLNARETAPAGATQNMFHGNSTLSQRGGLSVAIPGELRGYQEAFDKYGSKNVTWERLLRPTIELCRNGYKVAPYFANILKANEAVITSNPGLSEFLVDQATGKVLEAGDILKRIKLAKTLDTLSGVERAEAVYNGTLTDELVREIQEAGGIITRADLEHYQPVWVAPVTATIGQHTMYSVPLPGSGVIVAFILNIINQMTPTSDQVTKVQRIVEAFKFGYGRRTELGDNSDPSFVPDSPAIDELVRNLTSASYAAGIIELISDTETHSDAEYYGAVLAQPNDHGTAHVSVLDQHGNAVSVTSTINLLLGSRLVSESTGILLNDEMDDFSSPNITNGFDLPPSPANFIHPGKRPLSSMCPSIFVHANNEVSLVTGAAGGSKITTATALMAIITLLDGQTIKEAADAPRFHHQLFPMSIDYEYGITDDVVSGLEKIGHSLTRSTSIGSTVTGIKRQENNITAIYDYRRGGSVDGF